MFKERGNLRHLCSVKEIGPKFDALPSQASESLPEGPYPHSGTKLGRSYCTPRRHRCHAPVGLDGERSGKGNRFSARFASKTLHRD